jgi:glyoxylase-like metal-dependent hydrolase (beta-lactamase superfamily II)
MRLHPIEAGNFKLDGGAMFGVVPKTLWERTNPSDDKNRIEMASRCLLVEEGKRLILIDTGMGNKQGDSFFRHYGLWGDYSLVSSLALAGFHPDDITDVFFTHLHFDHCGGAVNKDNTGKLIPAFKNAYYWVHKSHWEWATFPNAREKASFLPDNILPLEQSGQLKFIEDPGPFIKETPFPFSIQLIDGHTEKQMLPLIEYQGEKNTLCGRFSSYCGTHSYTLYYGIRHPTAFNFKGKRANFTQFLRKRGTAFFTARSAPPTHLPSKYRERNSNGKSF